MEINSCLKVLTKNKKAVKMSFQLKLKDTELILKCKRAEEFHCNREIKSLRRGQLEIGFYDPPSYMYLMLQIFRP